MKKALRVLSSIIAQLLIWIVAYSCFFGFIADSIKHFLGDTLYSTYGKALRPYMLLYFFVIFILTEIAALVSNKLIKIQKYTYLYAFVTLLINVIIFYLIINYIVLRYEFVV